MSVTQQYETNVTSAKKRRTLHHIGFAVYEVPPAMTRLTPQYVLEHVSIIHFLAPSGAQGVTIFVCPCVRSYSSQS